MELWQPTTFAPLQAIDKGGSIPLPYLFIPCMRKCCAQSPNRSRYRLSCSIDTAIAIICR